MTSGHPEAAGFGALDPGRPEPLFDAAWYLAEYPDVAAEIGTNAAWAHFVLHGEREGRAPGPDFDPEFYRRTHLPLEGEMPFTHYVAEGRRLGYAPRVIDASDDQTRSGIRAALRGRLNPVLLLGNDARSAGGPLLLLEIAGRLRARGRSPVFLLRQGGPLFPRFAALGPTLIAAEGWNLPVLGASLPASMPVLANTSWGALLAQQLGVAERSVVLVHEMPDYILAQDLLGPISEARTVITSMPRIEAELIRLLDAAPSIRTVLPGLQAPAVSAGGTARIRRELAGQFGAGDPVFLGAGYADQRKGFDLFLEAARAIAVREPRAGFVWLGETGAWARSLAEAAQDSGLRLLLPGFRTDAGDWYAASAVYLLTSRQDPGPTTVMDAARLGVPFVGLAADIGLRDLAEITAATGEFVDSTEELAERAVRLLGTESAASRQARAAFVRDYRSFDGYVDDLERALVDASPASVAVGRMARGRARARLAVLDLRSNPLLPALARTGARSVGGAVRRAKRLAPRVSASAPRLRRRRPVAIAIVQDGLAVEGSGALPASTLSEPAAVSALTPGSRAWVSTPVLLSTLNEEVDLYILRRPGAEPWQLVRELEVSGRGIGRVTQHDLSAAPQWALTGAPPPRPRRLRRTGGPPQAAVVPAPRGPVRLPRSIGVFVHAYYVDLVKVIADRLDLISHPVTLYVSTDDSEKAAEIARMLPAAVVRVFANQGRDIAPKVFGFAASHAAHDVVLHLHTKRSPHRGDLAGWFDHLLDCLLPSSEGVNAILGLFADSPSVGMISPAWFEGLSPTVQWGPNRAIAEVLTWNAGWPALPDDRELAFAAGSMFWARSAALRPVQTLAIPPEAFGESAATDGTLAHAVERLIGVSCAAAGLTQLFVLPPDAASLRPPAVGPGSGRA